MLLLCRSSSHDSVQFHELLLKKRLRGEASRRYFRRNSTFEGLHIVLGSHAGSRADPNPIHVLGQHVTDAVGDLPRMTVAHGAYINVLDAWTQSLVGLQPQETKTSTAFFDSFVAVQNNRLQIMVTG